MSILFWLVYYPLLKILSFLLSWVPGLRKRRSFELKNRMDVSAESFKVKGVVADLCFEFSSEGEYQQVASLIDDALKAGKNLELVFFSPSVEKAIVALGVKYPTQVRYLRYPLVSLSPFGTRGSFSKWVTAKKLIMVRYDLFPEFLVWPRKKNHDLTLLWFTFKKERVKGKAVGAMKRAFLSSAKLTVYASQPDQVTGTTLGHSGPFYDFRIEQIRRRMLLREEKFKQIFPLYPQLKDQWSRFPREKRLIFGNAWPSDLFLLKNLPADLFVLVVPHQLTPDILKSMWEALTTLGRKVIDVDDSTQDVLPGDCILLNKKGVLCELYADFGLAYVGGGFEDGTHSLLEPLVAGSEALACGTLHHRSTEYDVAKEMDRVVEVKNPEEFLHWTKKTSTVGNNTALMGVFEKYENYRKDVISC